MGGGGRGAVPSSALFTDGDAPIAYLMSLGVVADSWVSDFHYVHWSSRQLGVATAPARTLCPPADPRVTLNLASAGRAGPPTGYSAPHRVTSDQVASAPCLPACRYSSSSGISSRRRPCAVGAGASVSGTEARRPTLPPTPSPRLPSQRASSGQSWTGAAGGPSVIRDGRLPAVGYCNRPRCLVLSRWLVWVYRPG